MKNKYLILFSGIILFIIIFFYGNLGQATEINLQVPTEKQNQVEAEASTSEQRETEKNETLKGSSSEQVIPEVNSSEHVNQIISPEAQMLENYPIGQSPIEAQNELAMSQILKPTPFKAGQPWTSAGNRVTAGDLKDVNTWIPAKYSFRMMWGVNTKAELWVDTSKIAKNSITTAPGWAPNTIAIKAEPKLSGDPYRGNFGVMYRNAATYNGEVYDVLVSFWRLRPNSANHPGYIQFHTNNFIIDMNTVLEHTQYIRFFKAGSADPVHVEGIMTFGDIDYKEEIAFDNYDISAWQKSYFYTPTWLQAGMIGATLRAKSITGQNADFENTPAAFITNTFSSPSVWMNYESVLWEGAPAWPPQVNSNGNEGRFSFMPTKYSARPTHLPEVIKRVSDNDEKNKEKNTLSSRNEVFNYTFRVAVPMERPEWQYKKFTFCDLLPVGLEPAGNAQVKRIIDNVDVTYLFNTTVTDKSGRKEVLLTGTPNNTGLYGYEIEVNLPVKIADNAYLSLHLTSDKKNVEIKNTVELNINDFVDRPTTKKSNVVSTLLKTGHLKIIKTDEAGTKRLANAVFSVKDTAGVEYLGSNTNKTNTSGELLASNLPPGKYTITEITAPVGYERVTASQTVIVTGNTTTDVIFKNKLIVGTLKIIKTDEGGTKKLANAVFSVKDGAGKEYLTGTTNKTNGLGEIVVTNLVPGDYTITEITAPPGYTRVTGSQVGKVTGNGTASVTFKNKLILGNLKIIKTDEGGSKKLANAVFSVKDGAGVEKLTPATNKTNVNGEITLANLVPGDYTVTEITAPAGYERVTASQVGKVTGNATASVTFKNKLILGNLKIIKTDEGGTKKLANAVFSVKDGAGKEYLTGTTNKTNANGEIVVTNLVPGDYTITETTAPAGYERVTASQIGKVTGNTTASVSFKNKLIVGSLKIIKTDEGGTKKLANAVFSVKDGAGVERLTPATNKTNAAGEITLTNLVPGDYTVTEITAPAGYERVTASQVGKVTGNTTASVSFKNKLIVGTLKIIKTDEGGTKKLANAVFSVKDGAGVEKLTPATNKTNAAGEITLANLVPGDYTVTEITAPTGYERVTVSQVGKVTGNGTASVSFKNKLIVGSLKIIKTDEGGTKKLANAVFSVKDEAGKEYLTDAMNKTNAAGEITLTNLVPGDYTITEIMAPPGYERVTASQVGKVTGNGAASVSFKNKVIVGTLKIIKTDEAGTKKLANAVFSVKDGAGKEYLTDATNKTNTNGEIIVSDLVPGDYTVTETKAPVGYELVTGTQTGTVAGKETVTINFKNKLIVGSLKIVKTNEEGSEKLANAVFSVKDRAGKEYLTDETNKTNAAGEIIVSNLVPGDYTVTETKAPVGYELVTGKQTGTVVGKETATVTFKNKLILGALKIIKTDEGGTKKLANAVFSVKDETGKEYLTDVTNKTNTDGEINISNLLPGDYTVTETKAPVGYELVTGTQTGTVVGKETVTVNFKNKLIVGSLKIVKTNEDSTKKLADAEFSVKDAKGKEYLLAPANKTNDVGELVVEKLVPGKYVVTETKAPYGYDITLTKTDVTIEANKEFLLTVKNKAQLLLNLRQTVINPNDELVLATNSYHGLKIYDEHSQLKSAGDLVAKVDSINDHLQIKQKLFTTVRLLEEYQQLVYLESFIPEYYEYVGHVTTFKKANLSQHISGNKVAGTIELDYEKEPEYWVTVFIQPKLGLAENEPRPYSWSSKLNPFGKLIN